MAIRTLISQSERLIVQFSQVLIKSAGLDVHL